MSFWCAPGVHVGRRTRVATPVLEVAWCGLVLFQEKLTEVRRVSAGMCRQHCFVRAFCEIPKGLKDCIHEARVAEVTQTDGAQDALERCLFPAGSWLFPRCGRCSSIDAAHFVRVDTAGVVDQVILSLPRSRGRKLWPPPNHKTRNFSMDKNEGKNFFFFLVLPRSPKLGMRKGGDGGNGPRD